MNTKKKILLGSFLALCCLCAYNCSTIIYGIQQGNGQLKIVRNAEPLEDFLNDANYPDSLKEKIKLVKEIKQFAFDSLGINFTENYSKLYDQKGQPGMWVVTGCKPFALEQYFWKFPFLGKFSYKGYFKKERAYKEEAKLKEMGYDADVGTVNAWSTLGWFNDPVMSSMLEKKPGQLARVLIHELTHGTLFVKDSVAYNENLATFIGDKGAIIFLRSKYGPNSKELEEYLGYISDMEKFMAYMVKSANTLDSLYKNWPKEINLETKKKTKRKHINAIIDGLKTIDTYKKDRFDRIYAQKDSINNTFFTDFLTYREGQKQFEKEFNEQFGGDFDAYLSHLKKKYPSL